MYESFGFNRADSGEQSIKLFVPDNIIDPSQYSRGGVCNIAAVGIIGDFQHLVAAGVADWDQAAALRMTRSPHPNGYMFVYTFNPPLPDRYYQYQYVVRFKNGTVRVIGDPCTKYGGDSLDRSAFVLGGSAADPTPIDTRLPSNELIIYELMIDDFTRGYRGARAPIDAIADKLDLVQALNINAIEFMPWIAWPDDAGFSWGYNPAYFFSVESAYINDAARPLNRLSRMAALISECHRRNIHVLLDIVLQHVYQGFGTNGFPYYWLWQTPTDSPFTGQFEPASDFGMLPVDYTNACTQQFVTDVCKYWLTRFTLDGFRFDQVTGFDNPQYPRKGAPELIAELKSYAIDQNLDNISLILEDAWDFQVVSDANAIQPTGAWFDIFRSYPFDIFNGFAVKGAVNASYMRVLNSAFGFDAPILPNDLSREPRPRDHYLGTRLARSRFKAQPYMIALATCSGTVLLHNGQEWGQFENLWENDAHAPAQFKRVQSRPLTWQQRADPIGQKLTSLYAFLMGLRTAHPALRSPNFYPNYYDASWTHFSPDGYGIDEALQVEIYHRWDGADLYMIVLNFSDTIHYVNVPLPQNGTWIDLLNGTRSYIAINYQLANFAVQSNWGSILHFES